ncbi:MAG TPA: GIY-YIG nuclease family protein [Terriglobales bacterium]|jgi:putative endonuclease|nr:GIY-YIG nuclease family protein [Terriglobales bacterium]
MYRKYWVYIIASLSGTLYIGMTNNIERRVWEHKSGPFEGFASKYHCDRLVYLESFDDVRKAIDREKQLKGWKRSKKIWLIESRNRRWQEFGRDLGRKDTFRRRVNQSSIESYASR